MAKFGAGIVGCLVAICVVLVAVSLAPRTDAITCGSVAGALSQCLGYLRNGGPVPGPCCGGVKSINSQAKTPADRKAACGCLKQLASRTPGIKPGNAGSLPGKCGVNVGYPISASTDCSKVK